MYKIRKNSFLRMIRWCNVPIKAKAQNSKWIPSKVLIVTRNVRTLYGVGAFAWLVDAITKCRGDIIVIQEMGWMGHGCKRLPLCEMSHRCHNKNSEIGCGYMVTKSLRHLLSGSTPVNDRLVKAPIKVKF